MKSSKKLPVNKRTPSAHDRQIGERIRAIRIDRGMSQADLGLALGVSFQQIQKYERGTNRMSAARLHETAKALGTIPGELAPAWDGKATGVSFNTEAYKMAKAWTELPDRQKRAIRTLIDSLISAAG